jgi:hypothetical protein
VLIPLINNLAEYQILNVADEFRKSGYEETPLMISKEYSLTVILDLFDSWLNVSNMQFDRESNENSLTYRINHGMGKQK